MHVTALYTIEVENRRRSAGERLAVRQTQTKPLVDTFKTWYTVQLVRSSKGSTLAKEIN